MRDYLTIGPNPADEECSQDRGHEEARIFIEQIRRVLGPEPEGARLKVKSFPHDFGSYIEVVCYFDDDNKEAVDYAFRVEAEAPSKWDDVSRLALDPFKGILTGINL